MVGEHAQEPPRPETGGLLSAIRKGSVLRAVPPPADRSGGGGEGGGGATGGLMGALAERVAQMRTSIRGVATPTASSGKSGFTTGDGSDDGWSS